MFTGLIQTTGIFLAAKLSGKAGKLSIETKEKLQNPVPGESIAVNGACLTLERASGKLLEFHVLEETFNKTNLGSLQKGSTVNLERALALGDRLGGHIVSGHVDGLGRVLSLGKTGDDTVLKVACTPELRRYMVPKGSIAINGVSLTIAELFDDSFTVHIIPTTWNETNLAEYTPKSMVNLECDMLGKYIHSMLSRMDIEKKNPITMETLKDAGFSFH